MNCGRPEVAGEVISGQIEKAIGGDTKVNFELVRSREK